MGGLVYSKALKQQGFTLLEIMVAFVITGLVVGTLLQLFGSAMQSAALADEYSFAVQVAESRMEAVGSEIKIEPTTVSGQEEGSAYKWTVTMQPIELHDKQDEFSLSVEPYQVIVVVSWSSEGKQRQFTLTSLRFGEKS
ncbi:type IV pilus modification PilV family protein [Thiothrix eikelboomii]|uniref:General secretion pathway protein I n=1 Tax=Thiothrix eikelboomii TaxID=92487 RepID=A0A1T4VXJ2_9GAMM|nr:prepilin-type N-terminal cleavage/methylation domain-containing protein [Thiothrix eikelboomii]SKA69722.1 general secretion pathway protein I [Thiothrix eikelboomii]